MSAVVKPGAFMTDPTIGAINRAHNLKRHEQWGTGSVNWLIIYYSATWSPLYLQCTGVRALSIGMT